MGEYGSVVNMVMATSKAPEPEPGMGATICYYSDRKPATVEKVVKGTGGRPRILVRADKYERIDNNGMSEMQEYAFKRDPEGVIYWFEKDRKGKWRWTHKSDETGRWSYSTGCHISLGKRSAFYDFTR